MNRENIAEELVTRVSMHNCKEFTNILNDASKGLFVVLKLIKNSKEDVVPGDISLKLNVSTARTAVALKTLEAKKWIKMYKSSTDQRKKVVKLTETGEAILNDWDNKLIMLAKNFLEKLTDEEVEQLFNIFKKVI